MRVSQFSTIVDTLIETQRDLYNQTNRTERSSFVPSEHIHPRSETLADPDVKKVRDFLDGKPPEKGSNVVELVNKMIF